MNNSNNIPLIAVVGRPNVGKSSFVNRITGHDDAIVHSMRGVTRDRSYHLADWNGQTFKLIDTGGIELGSDDKFCQSIKAQAIASTEESDLVIFIVDGTSGIQTDDLDIANILKKSKVPVILVVNKLDIPNDDSLIWEFYNLGLGDPYPISALHGHGTGDLLDSIVKKLQESNALEDKPDNKADSNKISIAIIGRPNAGKSSLTNCLCKKNRSIVSDVAGTTRDSIDTQVTHDGKNYTIIDTAGLRKKSVVKEDVEYYSFIRALRAIDRCDVAVLVIDATLGLTDQDQRVAGMAKERACGLVIVLNKWDIAGSVEQKAQIREHLEDRMEFVSYAKVVQTNALSGKNVEHIWGAVDCAYKNYNKQISTSKLNNWLITVKEFGYTVTKGKLILRLKYVTQTGTEPPRFTFFVNNTSLVNDNFERFLENRLRDNFDFSGTPIYFKFKSNSK